MSFYISTQWHYLVIGHSDESISPINSNKKAWDNNFLNIWNELYKFIVACSSGNKTDQFEGSMVYISACWCYVNLILLCYMYAMLSNTQAGDFLSPKAILRECLPLSVSMLSFAVAISEHLFFRRTIVVVPHVRLLAPVPFFLNEWRASQLHRIGLDVGSTA